MRHTKRFRPLSEILEGRQLLASDTGANVASLIEYPGRAKDAIVIQFNEGLDPTSAASLSNYQVNLVKAGTTPSYITSTGKADRVTSASYDDASHSVTLSLARPLASGESYRVFINGDPTNGLLSASGTPFDGDADFTPGGNFYGLVSAATRFRFKNAATGEQTNLVITGGGQISLWRDLNGNLTQLNVIGNATTSSVVRGTVYDSTGNTGELVTPTINTGVAQNLVNVQPGAAGNQPVSPQPIVANSQNLPYSIVITPLPSIQAPALQSATYAQQNGLWLEFGGRTNGLHGFDSGPGAGVSNFPPDYQNNAIYVINPSTGMVWSMPWSQTGLPVSVWKSLASENQQFYQAGNTLYASGGYSQDPTTGQFTTYDTLSSINVSGLIKAVQNGTGAAGLIQQIHSNVFQVTGGEMNRIGNRTYLVFGQTFQGGYQDPNATQVYTDSIRSFRIVHQGNTLKIVNYRAQFDPVNFRRRDGNLAVPAIMPNGKVGLEALGGAFTIDQFYYPPFNSPTQTGYQQPVLIGSNGKGSIDSGYQQFFSQYTSPHVSLYDSKTGTTDTISFGGISLYDYNPITKTLTSDIGLPWVNDVTTLAFSRSGQFQEYIMNQIPNNVGPFQSPGQTNLYGANASFFVNPNLSTYRGEILNLRSIKTPVTLGYIYGGIVSSSPNTFNNEPTAATGAVFRVTIMPN